MALGLLRYVLFELAKEAVGSDTGLGDGVGTALRVGDGVDTKFVGIA